MNEFNQSFDWDGCRVLKVTKAKSLLSQQNVPDVSTPVLRLRPFWTGISWTSRWKYAYLFVFIRISHFMFKMTSLKNCCSPDTRDFGSVLTSKIANEAAWVAARRNAYWCCWYRWSRKIVLAAGPSKWSGARNEPLACSSCHGGEDR